MKIIAICKKDVIMEGGQTRVFTSGHRYNVDGFSAMDDQKEDHIIFFPGHVFFNEYFNLVITNEERGENE